MLMRGGIGVGAVRLALQIASTASSVLRVANREVVGRIIPTKRAGEGTLRRVKTQTRRNGNNFEWSASRNCNDAVVARLG
jgi:hypothetical protein